MLTTTEDAEDAEVQSETPIGCFLSRRAEGAPAERRGAFGVPASDGAGGPAGRSPRV